MEKTYLFYDIETTGLNKCFDQIVQFAAIRTDSKLNEIERHEYFIKLKKDVIPVPEAFITHRIPLSKLDNGLDEHVAIKKIHTLFNQPRTISIGYNTLGFDDEFLRFSFYRNLLAPYTHQYANDCIRMDLYPITVAYHLFKNETIKWPENGLKLENIARLNNLATGQAHNALTDVIATLELAKAFYQEQTMWQYLCGFFDKETDVTRCNVITQTDTIPIAILIDGKFGITQQYQSPAIPLGTHLHYKNQSLWLRLDRPELSDANLENFVDNTWVVNKKFGEPSFVLPMKKRFMKAHLIDKQEDILATAQKLHFNKSLWNKIGDYYRSYIYPKLDNVDPAGKIYEAGFMSYQDENLCKQFHLMDYQKKLSIAHKLSPHLQELAFRILGHQDDTLLTEELRSEFQIYCDSILQGQDERVDHTGKKRYTRQEALADIQKLEATSLDAEQQMIILELKKFLS